jgi:alkanesulfonate monooxygenase SsuD/methylene tetrahydromethanopterin reductase-like flavin-dependent oxidoreductase (luciferase family)
MRTNAFAAAPNAEISSDTPRIRPMSESIPLPYRSPRRVANQTATRDIGPDPTER